MKKVKVSKCEMRCRFGKEEEKEEGRVLGR